jgi:hypothetical protein
MIGSGYFNADGFLTVKPNSPSVPGEGNGLLQTGLWYSIKARNGGLQDRDKDAIKRITSRCMHDSHPILWRSPHKKNPDDDQQHDDYWGWLAACYFAESDFPERFHQFCEDNQWMVDVQQPYHPRIKYLFERFPGFKTFVKLCVHNRKPTPMECIKFALLICFWSIKPNRSDSCMRSYCRIAVASDRSLLCRLVASILWFKRVRKLWGSVGNSFAPYFKGNNHPITWYDWN